MFFATIQNKDKHRPECSPENPQRSCMLQIYAESKTWQTQAQRETTNGNIEYVKWACEL